MKSAALIIAASALSLGLAACAEPEGGDTADMAPDATTADVTAEGVVGDSDDAPDMATVQLALEEACPTMVGPALQLDQVTCEADNLTSTADCSFAFVGDPADLERRVGLTQAGEGWRIDAEPAFCSSLERADAMAEEPEQADIETTPED